MRVERQLESTLVYVLCFSGNPSKVISLEAHCILICKEKLFIKFDIFQRSRVPLDSISIRGEAEID